MKKQKVISLDSKRAYRHKSMLHGGMLVCTNSHKMKWSKFRIGDLVKQKKPNAWPFIRSGEEVTMIECDHKQGVMLVGFNGLAPQFDENLFEPAQATVFKFKGKKRET